MADFVAVLRKTIDGLGETTPEMRRRVYEKARATVANKLAALNPPPPAAVAERQKKTLEDAIAEIEASFSPPPPRVTEQSDPLAELENVFASLKAKPAESPPLPSPRKEPDPKPWPMTTPKPAADAHKPAVEPAKPAPEMPKPSAEGTAAEPVTPIAQKPTVQTPHAEIPPLARQETARPQAGEFDTAPDVDDRSFDDGQEPEDGAELEAPRRRRGYGKLLAAAVVLAALAGGGYAAWLNKDRLTDLVKFGRDQLASTEPESEPGAPPTGTLTPPEKPASQPSSPSSAAPEAPKFTQRLNADGSETDAGPAGGEAGVGEGTSVASATTPPAAGQTTLAPPPATPENQGTAATDDATPPAGATPAPADGAQAPADAATPPVAGAPGATAPGAATPPVAQVAVGQKAIFYEERTNSAQGSAESGQVVWSVVQESPGNDLPPEPAIRGEATIPGKDLQLRMTIRRNADQTLPASHIIELIFLTPENFEGGGIDNILRFALKGTEEAAGSPLIGIPAKIADGFFLVALNDSKAEMDANLTLLRREKWIDVPVIYKSGRRALITMEKGIPGEKVFDDALKAWQTANAG
ncbi:hypothetical protein MesoLjLc_22530 [Mesorhizobium sp. L-8-10]|uniref:hypothetical protein n=1 Tax=Mesorhizobium sp. L-8-10 TaxID=2744523 RepID=UPI00192519FA|nr:hypothetical protein [Mesorhizobium sp. L-8-10]BCH30323.1 hypothetical protein MesoLjLc_22530 [Mesorhizobium sp. L-8-10]